MTTVFVIAVVFAIAREWAIRRQARINKPSMAQLEAMGEMTMDEYFEADTVEPDVLPTVKHEKPVECAMRIPTLTIQVKAEAVPGVRELRKEAREKGIKSPHKYRKHELLEMLGY